MVDWTVDTYLKNNQKRMLEELLEFVRIPSISTSSQHKNSIKEAADFVKDKIIKAGPFEVELIETQGHPVIFADYFFSASAPTVLVYGHYDVQPPEPLHEWTNPPFEPTQHEDIIVARGISDDKAPMFIPIKVAEAFFATEGKLSFNLKLLFEGEEEIGSPNLNSVINQYKERLKADFVLSADGAMWSAQHPTITTSSRGICFLEFSLSGAMKDLHSGRHGGAVANPLHAMASLIASLHSDEGRVAIEGFYDAVVEVSTEQRELIASLPFKENEYLTEVGSSATYGEKGFSTLERQWYRPTLEVNGMWGGYQGEGSKTVLPREAHAKVTCRLVPDQDPVDIRRKLERHLKQNCPHGVRLNINSEEHYGLPYSLSKEHFALRIAQEALKDVYGVEPWIVGMGGTLPISQTFKEVLGMDTIFFSFAVGDENIHAPNEFFRTQRFFDGLLAWAKFFQRLSSN